MNFVLKYQPEKIIKLEDIFYLKLGKYFVRNRLFEQGNEQPIDKSKLVKYVIKLQQRIEKNKDKRDSEEILISGPMRGVA